MSDNIRPTIIVSIYGGVVQGATKTANVPSDIDLIVMDFDSVSAGDEVCIQSVAMESDNSSPLDIMNSIARSYGVSYP